jgi:phospholipid/cholesterol/gamma-HCH transport system substrate-binding protein
VKYTKEIKTGIVVVVAVAVFIYGFNFLKGRDIFSTNLDLYAVYDNVNGVTANNTVQINGFKVGTVRDVTLDPVTNKLIVHFIITDKNAIITKTSSAQIFSDGLLGYKAIRIINDPRGIAVQDGDTLIGALEGDFKEMLNEQMLPLKRKIESLVSSIDSVVTVFQVVLGDSAQGLMDGFASIRLTLANFERTSYRLDTLIASEALRFSDIMSKIQSISTNLANNKDTINLILSNMASITDSLAKSNFKQAIANANTTMANVSQIMDKINRGEGSLGLLLNDKRLYNDLVKTNTDLDALIIDLKAHPKRYFSIFGRDKSP